MFDVQLAQQAATLAVNLGAAFALGANASAAWLARRTSGWAIVQGKRARKAAAAGMLATLAASMALLWCQSALVAETGLLDAAPAAYAMATATHYGFAWCIGMAALAAGAALAFVARPTRSALPAYGILAALAVFLYTRSMVSHASNAGDVSWPVGADWLHLVLVCVWTGEVLVAGMLTLPHSVAGREDRRETADYLQHLSSAATVALAGIVATGLFSAWRNLGDPGNLTGNPYATVLAVKLGLVALAAALGGVNRFFIMPPLLRGLRGSAPATSLRRFVLVLRVEALVLLLVLVLAAVLSATEPPSLP